MEFVSRRVVPPLLTLTLLPAFSLLPSGRMLASETPSFLFATTAPIDRFSSTATWVDDLEQRLKTYFKNKYAAYDFAPYEQELDRIRSSVSRGDRWTAKREMGVFVKMLANHAYGLGDDAAEELAVVLDRIMPEEEFGIVYPGNHTTNTGSLTDIAPQFQKGGSESWLRTYR